MPSSLDEILAQMQLPPGGLALTQGGSATPGVLDDLLDFGKGAFFSILDVLDRPGRSIRHLLNNFDIRQALEAWDPSNFFTATPSRPISGGDVLRTWGVPEMGEGPLGITGRGALGFAGEFVTDPLFFLGGPIARSIGAAGKLSGRGATRFLEHAAAAGGRGRPSWAARRADTIAARLGAGAGAISQHALTSPGVGLVAGGTIGALTADDPEGGAVMGAILGGLGGAGLRGLPRLAEATLEGAEKLSPMFRRRGLGAEGAARLGDVSVSGGGVAMARRQYVLERAALQDKILQESGEARARQLTGLTEQIGFREAYAARQGRFQASQGVGGGNVPLEMFEQGPDALAQLEKALGRAAREYEKEILGKGGKDALDGFQTQIDGLTKGERSVLDDYFLGNREGLLTGGKIEWTENLIERGWLHREFIDDFMVRTNQAHVPHVKIPKGQEAHEVLSDMLAEVSQLAPEGLVAKALAGPPEGALGRVRQALAQAVQETKGLTTARKLMGSIDELNEKFPGMFETSLAKIGAADARRYIAAVTVDDFVGQIAKDAEWVQPAALRKGTALEGDWVAPTSRDLGLLPKKWRTEFEGKVVRREVAEELFGPKGKLARWATPDAPGKFLQMYREVMRYWKGYTLPLYPSWIGRNGISSWWHNWSAGVSGKTVPAAITAQRSLHEFTTGRALTARSVTVRGHTMKLDDDFLRNLVDDGAVQGGFIGSEGAQILEMVDPSKAALGPWWKRMWRPDPQQNLFTRGGFKANGMVEDNARIAHYLDKYALARQAGKSAAVARVEARRSMLRSLGDFRPGQGPSQLTRDIFPFAAWSMFNVPRTIRSLAEREGLAMVSTLGRLGITLDEEHKAVLPREAWPEYLQGQFAMPVRTVGGKVQVYSLSRWIPLADLAELDSPRKFAEFVVNLMSPAINEPLEQVLNYDTFFKRAIADYPYEQEQVLGVPLSRRDAHLLRNVRLLSEADRAVMPFFGLTPTSERAAEELAALTPAEMVLRTGLGLKPRPMEPAKLRATRLRKLDIEIGKIRADLRRAEQAGQHGVARNLRARLTDRQAQRRMAGEWPADQHPAIRAG